MFGPSLCHSCSSGFIKAWAAVWLWALFHTSLQPHTHQVPKLCKTQSVGRIIYLPPLSLRNAATPVTRKQLWMDEWMNVETAAAGLQAQIGLFSQIKLCLGQIQIPPWDESLRMWLFVWVSAAGSSEAANLFQPELRRFYQSSAAKLSNKSNLIRSLLLVQFCTFTNFSNLNISRVSWTVSANLIPLFVLEAICNRERNLIKLQLQHAYFD